MRAAKIVTIFGSSRAAKDSKAYQEAYQLGKLLAEAGFIVCNGGYGGTMGASSRGAKEAGGQTVGITTQAFRKSPANQWIDVLSQAENSIQRLLVMTTIADAFVVLRGGIGTLAEMTFVWTSTAIGEMQKPLVLVGDAWKKSLDDLSKHLLIRSADAEALELARTPEEAVRLLDGLWRDG